MGHSHAHEDGHGHSHLPGGVGDGTILIAVLVNLALTGAQILGGYVADSTALIADGVHNLSDALALVLAFGARRLARRPASPDMSFGWSRAEIVAAFVNYLALIAVSLWLAVEALGRLVDPPPVAAGLVMALAGFALVVDMATAALVWRASRDSVNIRAAFLHNLADAAVSVGVILGGAVIWVFGWQVVDPVLTLLISAVILWHVLRELGPVLRMLMLAAPGGVDHQALAAAMAADPDVARAWHLHLWQIDERRLALSAHLAIREGADPVAVVRRVKAALHTGFGIDHATIEAGYEDEADRGDGACADGDGHADHAHRP